MGAVQQMLCSYKSASAGTSFADRFLAARGGNVFGYKFDNDLSDISGNGYTGTSGGSGSSYSSDDPTGDYSRVLNGSGYVTISNSAAVNGNADRTLIAVVKMSASSFVSGSTLIYMGGSDNGSSAFAAFGLGCVGSSGAPKLRLDWERSVNDFSIPTSYVGAWATLILTHTAGSQVLYGALEGDSSFTVLGTSSRTLNTFGAGSPVGNWIGQWSGIRRFVGSIGFIGMKDSNLDSTEIFDFLLP